MQLQVVGGPRGAVDLRLNDADGARLVSRLVDEAFKVRTVSGLAVRTGRGIGGGISRHPGKPLPRVPLPSGSRNR
jgi:hypothetical protein